MYYQACTETLSGFVEAEPTVKDKEMTQKLARESEKDTATSSQKISSKNFIHAFVAVDPIHVNRMQRKHKHLHCCIDGMSEQEHYNYMLLQPGRW